MSSSWSADSVDNRGVKAAALRLVGLELICKIRDVISLFWAGVLFEVLSSMIVVCSPSGVAEYGGAKSFAPSPKCGT